MNINTGVVVRSIGVVVTSNFKETAINLYRINMGSALMKTNRYVVTASSTDDKKIIGRSFISATFIHSLINRQIVFSGLEPVRNTIDKYSSTNIVGA
jgi:hypothetical protein